MSSAKISRDLPDMTGLEVTTPLVKLTSNVTVLLVKIISATLYKSNELHACEIAHRMESVSKEIKEALNSKGPYSFWHDLVMGVFGRFGDSSKYIKLIYPIAYPKYVFTEACRKVGRYMESDRLDFKYEDRRAIHVGSFVLAMFGRVPYMDLVYDVLERVKEREVELENKLLEDEDFAIEVFHRIKLIPNKMKMFEQLFEDQLKKNIRLLVLFSKQSNDEFYNALFEREESFDEETQLGEEDGTYISDQYTPKLSDLGKFVLQNNECVASLVETHGGIIFTHLPRMEDLWTDEEVLQSMFRFATLMEHEYNGLFQNMRFSDSVRRQHWENAFEHGGPGTELLGLELSYRQHKSLQKTNVIKMLAMRGPMKQTYPTWVPDPLAKSESFWILFFEKLVKYYKRSYQDVSDWTKAFANEEGIRRTGRISASSNFWMKIIRNMSEGAQERDVQFLWGSPARCILSALVNTQAGEDFKVNEALFCRALSFDFEDQDGTTILNDKSITEFYGISIGTHSDSD